MSIDAFCSSLDKWLSTQSDDSKIIPATADALAKAFKVTTEEVSIFILDNNSDQLKFIWPPSLQKSGSVPLSSKQSLAVKTFSDKRTLINNNFTAVTHSAIFEMVSKSADPIQKIISSPLIGEGGVYGLVQVCRKGSSPEEAGADFGKQDQQALEKAITVLTKYIKAT